MDPGQQKELNLLLASPQVPEITDKVGAKAEEMVNFVDNKPEPAPVGQTVITVRDEENHTYVPQVGNTLSVDENCPMCAPSGVCNVRLVTAYPNCWRVSHKLK